MTRDEAVESALKALEGMPGVIFVAFSEPGLLPKEPSEMAGTVDLVTAR